MCYTINFGSATVNFNIRTMNRTFLTALIAVILFLLISLALSIKEREMGATFGMINLVGTALCFVSGIALCIPNNSREIGKGLLIASGVLFITGLSVCSQSAFSFH